MNPTGQLKAPQPTFLVQEESQQHLLLLIGMLVEQLNDAITVNHLRNLCLAIANEIDAISRLEEPSENQNVHSA
jgi:hypothetical protein